MLLAVAVPAGLAAAVAYGFSTAVQHDVAHTGTGAADAGGLVGLLRSRRWWASVGGDGVGTVLQLVALATGPVVLIQPMFVLCLLVALPVRTRLGGPPPRRADLLACLLLVLGLGGFFLTTGQTDFATTVPVATSVTLCVTALIAGGAIWLLARRLPSTPRAVVLSAVAGAWFGVEAVLVNLVSAVYGDDGASAFVRADGLVPLVGAAVIGLLGFVVTQVAFQIGALGASFPAMLVVDPLVAVVLAAAVLGERIPTGAGHLSAYAVCLVAIVLATVRLADPDVGRVPSSAASAAPDKERR